jgi:hypothetical protein
MVFICGFGHVYNYLWIRRFGNLNSRTAIRHFSMSLLRVCVLCVEFLSPARSFFTSVLDNCLAIVFGKGGVSAGQI